MIRKISVLILLVLVAGCNSNQTNSIDRLVSEEPRSYLLYIGSISRYGRLTTVKITAATVVILLLVSFLTRDLFILMLGRFSTRPGEIDLSVGLHSSNITKLDFDEFDRFFHLEVTWANVYSDGPNSADWSNTDWQIDYADQYSIEIYFLITPQPPNWYTEEHPDAVDLIITVKCRFQGMPNNLEKITQYLNDMVLFIF